jgi:hypothetical protein
VSAIWNSAPWWGWLCAGWFLVVIAAIVYGVQTAIPDPYEDVRAAVASGSVTINEVREYLGLPATPPESENFTPDWDWPEFKAADCREGRTHGRAQVLLPARRGDL